MKAGEAELRSFAQFNRDKMARDRDGNPVFLAKSVWDVGYQAERHPDIVFSATRER